MQLIKASEFTADRAWGSQIIALMQGISTRLHWTDEDYVWHINDGEEVFVVLDGQVRMYYRHDDLEVSALLNVGDIFKVDIGEAHKACPIGEARVLVVERSGSI